YRDQTGKQMHRAVIWKIAGAAKSMRVRKSRVGQTRIPQPAIARGGVIITLPGPSHLVVNVDRGRSWAVTGRINVHPDGSRAQRQRTTSQDHRGSRPSPPADFTSRPSTHFKICPERTPFVQPFTVRAASLTLIN